MIVANKPRLMEADFHGPYIDYETGLQYKNFGSKFVGDAPLVTQRNYSIAHYIRACYPPHAIRAYWQAFDAASGSFADRDIAGLRAGRDTQCWGSTWWPSISKRLSVVPI